MKTLFRAFTAHPASVGESYLQHMGSAFSFAAAMFATGLAVLIHGLFPFLFTSTGKRAILRLHERMVTHRVRGEVTHTGVAPATAHAPSSTDRRVDSRAS